MVEGRRERERERGGAASVAAVCCTRRMVYVSSAQGTIGGMGGKRKDERRVHSETRENEARASSRW